MFKKLKADVKINEFLQKIGVPSYLMSYRGYLYIKEAIFMTLDNSELMKEIYDNEIYSLIADKYRTTSSRVERGICHAIEVVWYRGNIDILGLYFNNDEKPANTEFITVVSNIVINN